MQVLVAANENNILPRQLTLLASALKPGWAGQLGWASWDHALGEVRTKTDVVGNKTDDVGHQISEVDYSLSPPRT